ncbi:6-phosphogluconate dehydrogenase, partial [Xanthomonas campestris]
MELGMVGLGRMGANMAERVGGGGDRVGGVGLGGGAPRRERERARLDTTRLSILYAGF